MQPDLDAVADEFRGVVDLIVVDAAVDPERAASLRVRGTPTLIAMHEGTEIARITGRRTRNELRDVFTAVASGRTSAIPLVGANDRFVWSLAGTLLAAAGLLSGPTWVLVGLGALIIGFSQRRSAIR